MGVSVHIKMGSRGQIVVPKVFRDYLGLKEGGEVVIEVSDDQITIKPVKKDIHAKWEKIAREQGFDIKREGILYGDSLYKKVMG
ncbi:MAG: AbrB/MazE/SpoVT family DNA-binding domain-containing protein [Candidatus Hydrothermarchaeales archaeon]